MDIINKIDLVMRNISEAEETAYQKFFKKKLKEFGVTSPAKLSEADKKKFYNEIETQWTKDKN